MLVSGLINSSLSEIISAESIDYSHVHASLYKCARDMLAKYKQKQECICSVRLKVKTQAVEILLSKLDETPKAKASRATISAALKSHVEALQGYEHLLSEKGNNYALMEQTQGLREDCGRASLLRYHDLKNKLLGPGTQLNAEQKKVICKLAEMKSLSLKKLEFYSKVTQQETPVKRETLQEAFTSMSHIKGMPYPCTTTKYGSCTLAYPCKKNATRTSIKGWLNVIQKYESL